VSPTSPSPEPTTAPDQPAPAGSDDDERRSLLTEARAAEADGRYLDAVELFTRANRLKRAPKVEHRIISLRNRAFPTVQAEAGDGPSWPPPVADPFPDVAGIPEIPADRLDAAVLGGSILYHGGLIVRELVSRDDAKVLRKRAARALDARDEAIASGDPSVARPWYHPFEPEVGDTGGERVWVQEVGGMLAADAPGLFFDVLELYGRNGVIDAIRTHMGERPVLSFNKCVVRRMTSSAPTWHQDGKFIGSHVRAVDVWLSLSECGGDTDTVGLDIVPRRFDDLLDTDGYGSTFPNSIGQELIDIVSSDTGTATPRFSPGDAIVFDDRFVHRSSCREGLSSERYAIESWFFAPSHYPMQYMPVVV
jgi:hypothetical protein